MEREKERGAEGSELGKAITSRTGNAHASPGNTYTDEAMGGANTQRDGRWRAYERTGGGRASTGPAAPVEFDVECDEGYGAVEAERPSLPYWGEANAVELKRAAFAPQGRATKCADACEAD